MAQPPHLPPGYPPFPPPGYPSLPIPPLPPHPDLATQQGYATIPYLPMPQHNYGQWLPYQGWPYALYTPASLLNEIMHLHSATPCHDHRHAISFSSFIPSSLLLLLIPCYLSHLCSSSPLIPDWLYTFGAEGCMILHLLRTRQWCSVARLERLPQH